MSKVLKILTVVGFGVVTISCGGGGGSSDSLDDFCGLLEDANMSELDPTNDDDLDELQDLLDELADTAPEDLEDAIATIQDAADAIADNDTDQLEDPDFIDDVQDATDELNDFAEDDCGIDLSGESDPDDTDGPDETDAPDDTEAPDETLAPENTDTGASIPDDTEAPVESDGAIIVTDAGIGFFNSYGEQQGTWAALVKNEGTVIAEYVEIQATFRDAAGNVVGTDDSYVSEILPGETRAVGSDFIDDVPATAVTVDAVANSTDFRPADENPVSVSFTGVTVAPTDSGVRVLGEATATAASTVENPSVIAVFRDPSGAIIGGTTSYLGFIPVGSSVGVEVQTSLELPAGTTAELYADSFSYSFDDGTDGTDVEVVDSGFSTFDSFGTPQGTWAAIVSNPNTDLAASYVSLIATFRDAAGAVVAVAQESITSMAPGSQSASASDYVFDLPESAASVTVAAHASEFVSEPAAGAFTVNNPVTSLGEYGLMVVGEVASTFPTNVEYVDIVAVFRDGTGAIIGGSVEYLDFVPANSSIGFTVESSIQRSDAITGEVFVDYGGAYDE